MPQATPYTVKDRLEQVETEIAAACRAAGRRRGEVRLMAVSKQHPAELLLQAAEAGQRLFGENRVQELAGKTEALGSLRASLDIHLIGHLQSNKSARAAELFSAVDTLDSLRLADRLHAQAQVLERTLPVLVEIKLSDEIAKEGLSPESSELEALLERLPDYAAHLPLRGLMTVPPISDDPSVAQDCFRTLRTLRDALARRHPRLGFEELSMGMSGDFPQAIAEGSTTVRIGTAIFGARPRPNTA